MPVGPLAGRCRRSTTCSPPTYRARQDELLPKSLITWILSVSLCSGQNHRRETRCSTLYSLLLVVWLVCCGVDLPLIPLMQLLLYIHVLPVDIHPEPDTHTRCSWLVRGHVLGAYSGPKISRGGRRAQEEWLLRWPGRGHARYVCVSLG